MVAFTGEGSTDEVFLGTIINRTLEDISLRHGNAFDLISVSWLGSSKGKATLNIIKKAYEQGAQLLIVHRDTDQHSPTDTARHHIQPLLDQISADLLNQMPVVSLIIRHEQETWLFADLDSLEKELDGRLDRQALNLPPNIETRANTKELFNQALREASKKRGGRRGYDENDVIEALATTIRLSQLARLSSYQHFVTDMEAALRQIGYIS
jgi:hypothetical protein